MGAIIDVLLLTSLIVSSFIRIVGDDDGGTLFTPEEYEAYKKKVLPQVRTICNYFISLVHFQRILQIKCLYLLAEETIFECLADEFTSTKEEVLLLVLFGICTENM